MAEINDSFFENLEQQFSSGPLGRKPIPLTDFSPIHGVMQYAHELQGDLRKFNLSSEGTKELGRAAAYILDERLRTLKPEEMSLSFVALKSLAILEVKAENDITMFDFDGIHIINGTPKEFIYGKVYDRPTLSLTFENSEFLSKVPLAEEHPDIPSDFLAIPVYSLRLDK